MKTYVLVIIAFSSCAFIYGSTSAMNKMALKYFSPEVAMMYRMLIGFLSCLVIFLYRIFIKQNIKNDLIIFYKTSLTYKLHLIIGSLINLGFPHVLIAIAQLWCQSALVQITKPITPIISQILSHFCFHDEPFTFMKFISILFSLIGVTLNAIPSFINSNKEYQKKEQGIGFLFILMGVSLFGLASVYFKKFLPNLDITISTLFQNLVSFLYCLILSLFIVKPKKIIEETSGASFEGFLWVTLLGVLSSNVAIHCYMYMIEKIGAVRTNFVPFGQIIIGVLLGIFWLKEWSNYKVWEIVISILGLILIFSAILFA